PAPVAAPVVEAPVVEAPVAVVEAPAPVAAAPVAAAPASVVGARAYRVHLSSRAAIVIGANLVEAAQKAVASGEDVLSIELIGEILA
ncbi:hypothetical protein L6R49_31075, partial [Myxococcota bacterium]|nr:hypothetical protein [Myxococcota bacterium]